MPSNNLLLEQQEDHNASVMRKKIEKIFLNEMPSLFDYIITYYSDCGIFELQKFIEDSFDGGSIGSLIDKIIHACNE